MPATTMSRRSFVASAAACGAAAAAASAVAAKPAEAKIIAETSDVWNLEEVGEPTETLECDIAIIGAGGTGMACACQAVQLGLEPIVLEKREVTGGSFIGTEGLFALQTPFTEESGCDMTPFEAIQNTMEYHHFVVNHKLYQRFFNMTADTVQWLQDLGVAFQGAIAIGNGPKCWHVYERDLEKGPGSTFQDSMLAAAENLGVQIELETPVKKILVGDDGAVTGVIAQRADGTYVQVNAPCVALATGGYPQNQEFLYAVSETRNELILPQGVPGTAPGCGSTFASSPTRANTSPMISTATSGSSPRPSSRATGSTRTRGSAFSARRASPWTPISSPCSEKTCSRQRWGPCCLTRCACLRRRGPVATDRRGRRAGRGAAFRT